jgi:hypothetical protein
MQLLAFAWENASPVKMTSSFCMVVCWCQTTLFGFGLACSCVIDLVRQFGRRSMCFKSVIETFCNIYRQFIAFGFGVNQVTTQQQLPLAR